MSRLMRAAILALVAFGVVAGIARSLRLRDLAIRATPYELSMMRALRIIDPIPETRLAAAVRFDRNFKAHPLAGLLHVLPGATFLAFGALQFSSDFRRRHLKFHRIAGRCLVIVALVGALAAFVLTIRPFAGNWERAAVAVFGGWWFVSNIAGYRAIRRHDQVTHRIWMIRSYTVALAISLDRVISIVLSFVLIPRGYTTHNIFLLSIWSGWIIAVIAAELWIRLPIGAPSALHAADHDARNVLAL